MIGTCTYVYPTGRPCRRIPKRGETLCPSHQTRRRSATSDELFERQMTAWVDHLQAMSLEQLLAATQESLNGIAALLERKACRAHRAIFTRAAIAAAMAAETLEVTVLLTTPPRSPTSASASPSIAAPTALSPAQAQARAASIEELSALCNRLATTFPRDSSEQGQ
jgi:hypothetical protein